MGLPIPLSFLRSRSHFILLAIFFLFGLSPFLPFSCEALAATYYIDATNGNDSSNALSPSTPWKTIAKINASSFNPGDQILFKRAGVYRVKSLFYN